MRQTLPAVRSDREAYNEGMAKGSRSADKTDPQWTRPVSAQLTQLGALGPLLSDPSITEIMINDTRNVMIEREGKLSFSGLRYPDLADLTELIDRLLAIAGKSLDPSYPCIDAMLPDGSRLNIVASPLAVLGPSITIRKFPTRRLSLEEMSGTGALDPKMAYLLHACVYSRINILISGGTGSGKTSLLNALLAVVPRSERIITIEDTAELVVPHANSVRMQTQMKTRESSPVVARDLLNNALRMRPDRIIVGECRGGEAMDMLQAMNTGHEGSMTTVHANSPRDALARLETLCLMSGVELPLAAVRKQIASAVDLIVHVKRFRSGARRVVSLAEVTGMEGEIVTLQDLFSWESTRSRANPDVGKFHCTGLVPSFLERLTEQGIEFPAGFFSD